MSSRWSRILRVLWQRPGFALAVVLTLVLGIGANTTIFSVVNGVLLRPLPYHEPDRLVQIQSYQTRAGGRPLGTSLADYLDWRAQSRTFEHLALYTTLDFNLPGDGTEPMPVRVTFATSELFALLNVPAHVGRAFVHPEERPGHDLYSVVLSHDLWRRRFSSDPGTIGRIIKLDTTSYRIVGVMPAGFRFSDNADAWAPLESWLDRFKSTMRTYGREMRGYAAIGRVRRHVDAAQAQIDLDTLAQRLEQQFPHTNTGVRFAAAPLREAQVSDIRAYFTPLLGAAAFVGLIACVNVTNLLLARAGERRKEVAVRIALGAGRGRVIRELLGESLVLSLLGGLLGLALAIVGVRALHASIPIDLPFWMRFDLDWRVVSYACALVLAIGTAASLAPAFQALRADHDRVLKEEGRGAAGSRSRRTGRNLLVVSEVSFSLVLLIGAGLMIRSFLSLRQVDPGFRSDHLLVVYVSPPGDRYKATPPYPAYASLYQRILDRLRQLPGVEGAAGSRVVPYAGKGIVGPGTPVTLDAQSPADQERNPLVRGVTISVDYFRVAGIPLLQGRTFAEDDTLTRPRVAIVNEAMARRLWPGADPLGKRIKPGNPASKDDWYTIVGIVGNVKYSGLQVEGELTVYYPYTQRTAGDLHFLIRTRGAPLDWAEAVEREIGIVDPDLAIYSLRTMRSIIAHSLWQQRLWGAVFAVFAAVASALALIGIYGVLAWSVRQRDRELGVRIALGAQRHDVIALVLRQGLRFVIAGLAAGLVAAGLLTRSLASLLFGVRATDPLVWLGVLGLLSAACALACYLPARRAAKVDPMTVLKQA